METLIYLAKVILCSAVLWAYYRLFLRDKSFHNYNRFYLLALPGLSLLLPLLKVQYFTVPVDSNVWQYLQGIQQLQVVEPAKETHTALLWIPVAIVSLGLMSLMVSGIFKVLKMQKSYPVFRKNGISFYETNLPSAPFSFFSHLFWNQEIEVNSPTGKQILEHELVHIRQKHSWDKLFLDFIRRLFWFNPVFFWVKNESSLVQEYLADHRAIQDGDLRSFAHILLKTQFSGVVLPGTSPFLSSNLKKRINMLRQTQNTKWSYLRRVAVLPLLFLVSFILYVKAENKKIQTTEQQLTEMLSAVQPEESFSADQQETVLKNSLIPVQQDTVRTDNSSMVLKTEDAQAPAKIVVTSSFRELPEGVPSAEELEQILADVRQNLKKEGLSNEQIDKALAETKKSLENYNAATMPATGGTMEPRLEPLTKNQKSPRIYIDDQLMEDNFRLDSVKPDDIDRIEVFKNDDGGEIKIYLKKK